ncbi:Sec-independent protein translocase family protein [Pengzhenrongella sicca]|uniref:Twin-arginine translocase TatA/TatE family subunit n=1 Tax=Pengzhenrongella sicca TaxID=2819238 RepID=A0A8A4ZE28_9MICO|nr:twin-arginine translocase TatA/TatE family subunit [Pengzhenrongella sicca]QTE28806.1 twin-arginine translocase TatA/TatE family subunit [Pengzhenrongella sicca]
MFDINGGEFLLLIVVAVIVVGPERLPRYAAQLGAWVRTARGFLRTAKERVDSELGDQVGDVDWTALDPRRYDPRRIVREALLDDPPVKPAVTPGVRTYTARATPGAAATAAAVPVAAAAAGISGGITGATGAASDAATAPAGTSPPPFDDEAT